MIILCVCLCGVENVHSLFPPAAVADDDEDDGDINPVWASFQSRDHVKDYLPVPNEESQPTIP